MDQGQAFITETSAGISKSIFPSLNRIKCDPMLSPIEVHADHYRNILIIESSLGANC